MQKQDELRTVTEDLSDLCDCIHLHKALVYDWVFRRTTDLLTTEPLFIQASIVEKLKDEVAVLKDVISKVEVENQAAVARLVRTEETTSQIDRHEEVQIGCMHKQIESVRARLMREEGQIQSLEQQAAYLEGVAATIASSHGKGSLEHEILCMKRVFRRTYRLAMLARSKLEKTIRGQSLETLGLSETAGVIIANGHIEPFSLYSTPHYTSTLKLRTSAISSVINATRERRSNLHGELKLTSKVTKARDHYRRQVYSKITGSLPPITLVVLPEREPLEEVLEMLLSGLMDSSSREASHIIHLQPSLEDNDEVILNSDFLSAYEVLLLERITAEEKRHLHLKLKELEFQHALMSKELRAKTAVECVS
jgi:hypothetical protein